MTVVVRHREHGWLRDSFTGGDYSADFDEAVAYPDAAHAATVMELAEIDPVAHQIIQLHAARAVAQILAIKGSQYANGGGNQNGETTVKRRRPDGTVYEFVGWDCVGAVVRAYRHLGWTRTMPGYAEGSPRISGVLHPNSWRHDALTAKQLVTRVDTPAIGDLICKPNTYSKATGKKVGYSHVEIVVDFVGAEWQPVNYDVILESEDQIPPWHLLVTAGARGPDKRKPAVVTSTMRMWHEFDAKWLKVPAQRTWLLRPIVTL